VIKNDLKDTGKIDGHNEI